MTSVIPNAVNGSVARENDADDLYLGEAVRLMNVDSNIFDDIHRAELSGPSSNPKLQLMGMPQEVREAILRQLLLKEAPIHVRFNPRWPVYDTPFLDRGVMRRHSTTIGPRITSILRVNKQMAQEATDVLYRENLFKTYDLYRFIQVFVKDPQYAIGLDNVAKIRYVCFGLPVGVTTLQFLPDFLCTELMNLKRLTLTKMTMHDMVTVLAQKDRIKHVHMCYAQELILEAAIITKFHPILRKAVWRRWSGSTLTKDNDLGVYDGGMEDPVFLRGEWFIDVVPEGHTAVLEGSVTVKDSSGEDTQSEDMVIDSRLVRQNPWFDRKAWMNIYNFALPSDATSSEVDPDQVVIWPGMGEDKCNLESVIDLLGLPPIPRPKYTWNEDVSDDSE